MGNQGKADVPGNKMITADPYDSALRPWENHPCVVFRAPR